jgi:hypothetical protein
LAPVLVAISSGLLRCRCLSPFAQLDGQALHRVLVLANQVEQQVKEAVKVGLEAEQQTYPAWKYGRGNGLNSIPQMLSDYSAMVGETDAADESHCLFARDI